MVKKPTIVWLRQDLRIADNPALFAAAERGGAVLPVYILDDDAAGAWRMGSAQRWFLHRALAATDLPVVLERGDSAAVLDRLISESGADAVFWNRRYEPWAIAQDKSIKASLNERGIRVESFAGRLLREPWQVMQKSGGPYKVYTPYSRAWLEQSPPRPPLPGIESCEFARADSLELADLQLHPYSPDWSSSLAARFVVSEGAAEDILVEFCKRALFDYSDRRNFPGEAGVSQLSAYLALGLISPHRVYQAAATSAFAHSGGLEPALPFLRQLIWRDFAHSNLYHFPHLPDRSLRAEFESYPWIDEDRAFDAWRRGRTGFPIVDAGMRELWQTGYMHNRVRMISGSFLTKDLLVHWRRGSGWFWDTLVDADLANNSMGWQWVAGSGIDTAPYFRIFNPTSQGEKFDPNGDYVRKFVPELAELPNDYIHRPHQAPEPVLQKAGVHLGVTYPNPIVDHDRARKRALAGYEKIRGRRG